MTDEDGWQVEFTTAARRDLRRLDPPIRARVLSAVKGLLADPAEGDHRPRPRGVAAAGR